MGCPPASLSVEGKAGPALLGGARGVAFLPQKKLQSMRRKEDDDRSRGCPARRRRTTGKQALGPPPLARRLLPRQRTRRPVPAPIPGSPVYSTHFRGPPKPCTSNAWSRLLYFQVSAKGRVVGH